MLHLLLQTRLRALVNSMRRGGKKSRRRWLGYAGLILLPLLVLVNIYAMMAVMMHNPGLGIPAVQLLLRNILLGVFIMLLFSGLALVLHIFFLSKDLPLLLSSPIPLTTILQFKLLETTVANSTLFFGIALPVLISAGIATGAPLLFWLVLLPGSLLFLAIPTGLGAFLAMGLVSVMPARKAKNVAAVFLSLISIAVWLGFQVLRPERIPISAAALPGQHILDAGARLSVWLPSDWLVNSLMFIQAQRYAAAAGNALLLVTAGLLLYACTSALLQRALHHDIFSGLEMTTHRRRRSRPAPLPALRRDGSLFGHIIRRDFRIIRRDTQQLMQILLFTLMMILLPFLNRGVEQSGRLAVYMPFLFLFIFSMLMGSTLATRMVPMERSAFGLFKLAPVRLRWVWLAKMTLSFLFVLCSGIFAAGIITAIHPAAAAAFVRILAVLAVLDLLATLCGGLFGAYFANFTWDHPKRMISAGSSFFLSLVLFGFLGLVGGLIALSFFLFNSPDPGILTSAVLALIAVALGTSAAEKKLDKIEWTY